MKFGAKEVMVIAAITFGIMAAGCSSPAASCAMDPHLRTMNTGGFDYRICLSKYEVDFYYPGGVPVCVNAIPAMESSELAEESLVTGGPSEADELSCGIRQSWTPSLPAFFK